MSNKMKETFDNIHAEEELKEKTKAFLTEKTHGYTKKYRVHNYQHLLTTAACLIFILTGSYWLYFFPTAEISIDINPSIELSVNRFDQVISVCDRNDDGKALVDSLHIKYKDYTEAIHQILKSEKVSDLLSEDETLSITVIGPDGTQCSRMISDIESCTAGHENSHCYFAHSEDVSSAHELGLSCGKYRAFLELQALDPDITPEQVQDMTMREIYDLINALSPDGESNTYNENCKGCGNNGHHNAQKGYGCKNKKYNSSSEK